MAHYGGGHGLGLATLTDTEGSSTALGPTSPRTSVMSQSTAVPPPSSSSPEPGGGGRRGVVLVHQDAGAVEEEHEPPEEIPPTYDSIAAR
jgi:hypothetical protein